MIYQDIIISEMVRYKKRIIIDGKDYIENPENRFSLTVMGAVAAFERAKIIERTTRGRLHRLRMGQLTSHGHLIFGYDYAKKTPTAPPALTINEAQAHIVRSIFETYASGQSSLTAISRSLEERGVPTRLGKPLWRRDQVKFMLRNPTYAGTRYFNRMTQVRDADDAKQGKRGKRALRDRAEWIAVSVPAIISQELFDRVQDRLQQAGRRYQRPAVHFLLSGLIECGECGRGYSSFRRYDKKSLVSGQLRVHHSAAYQCNSRPSEGMHDRSRIERCRNSRISTHILEAAVFDMISGVMLDPQRLGDCIDPGEGEFPVGQPSDRCPAFQDRRGDQGD